MKNTHPLASLFQKHQPELLRLIMQRFKRVDHEAEDIVQDAFHNILRTDSIGNLENPKAYLYQTASNLALNRIRKHQTHNQYVAGIDTDEGEKGDELTPERSFSASRDLQRVEHAIGKLPEKYRRTFLLSRVQDKTYREISELLNISESTVEKHIIKTLKFLRDELGGEADV